MWTTNYVYTYSSILMPTASITSKKSRLKVYNHTNIYLKNNSTFEIELHNPTTSRYLAKIYINGKPLSESGIIVNSGQRVFLERHIDEDSKFIFKTFEVDDVKETEAARAQNGLIEVKFFKELFNTSPYHQDIWYYNRYPGTSSGISYSLTTTSFTSATTSNPSLLNETKSTTETGRVFKGEKSNQKLKSGDGYFNQLVDCIYKFQLLPESAKAIEAQEIRQYCPECGLRIKKTSWKFCPNCGEEL